MDTLMVLDCETIPDWTLADSLGFKPGDLPIQTALMPRLDFMRQYSLNKSDLKSDIPAPAMNIILTVGIVLAKIERATDGTESYKLTHISSSNENEQALVLNLVQWLNRSTPRIVTYNGRTFDCPLLKMRALKYGADFSFWYKSGDKYNNYTTRYSTEYHMDIMDFLTDFGASSRLKLRELLGLLGLPLKVYSGEQVLDMFLAGDLTKIRNYAELDALSEFMCYLWVQRMRGMMTQEGFLSSVKSVTDFLVGVESTQPHLAQYLHELQEKRAA